MPPRRAMPLENGMPVCPPSGNHEAPKVSAATAPDIASSTLRAQTVAHVKCTCGRAPIKSRQACFPGGIKNVGNGGNKVQGFGAL
jgi:hypothetical protein